MKKSQTTRKCAKKMFFFAISLSIKEEGEGGGMKTLIGKKIWVKREKKLFLLLLLLLLSDSFFFCVIAAAAAIQHSSHFSLAGAAIPLHLQWQGCQIRTDSKWVKVPIRTTFFLPKIRPNVSLKVFSFFYLRTVWPITPHWQLWSTVCHSNVCSREGGGARGGGEGGKILHKLLRIGFSSCNFTGERVFTFSLPPSRRDF